MVASGRVCTSSTGEQIPNYVTPNQTKIHCFDAQKSLILGFLGLFLAPRMDDLKEGRLVGVDKYGNKYFENPYFFYGRNRWVEYSPSFGLEYDGSQIPAEWFGWMHYKVTFLRLE